MYELWEMIDDDIIITHPVLISPWYLLEIVRGSECAIADWDTRKSSLEEERYTEERTISVKYFLFHPLSPILIDSFDSDRTINVLVGFSKVPWKDTYEAYITGIRSRVKDRAPRNSGNSGNPGVSARLPHHYAGSIRIPAALESRPRNVSHILQYRGKLERRRVNSLHAMLY